MGEMFMKNYQYQDSITEEDCLSTNIMNIIMELIRLYLGRKKSVRIFDIIENESDIRKQTYNNTYTTRSKIIYIPQFNSNSTIGHYVLNIIDIEKKEIHILNSLREWKMPFNPGKLMFNQINSEIEDDIDQQPDGSLQCGFRLLYNLFKSVYSFIQTKSIVFGHDEKEFEMFMKFIVDINTSFIRCSELNSRKQKDRFDVDSR